jgi:hypothetical protein
MQTWQNWSSESRVCVSLKMTERRHIKPRLILVSSAHGTGRQSLSLQHSFGYQECAPAALLISCATTNKQTSFPISALQCPDPSKCMREDAFPMLPNLKHSASCLGHEDAKRQIRKDCALLLPHAADVACAIRRKPDHRLTEDSNTFPRQTVARGGQLAAGHWVAVVIVAALLGYQECAPAGLTISCATVSKQANVFISTLSGSI